MIAHIFDWFDALPDWQFALIMGVLGLVAIYWAWKVDRPTDDGKWRTL